MTITEKTRAILDPKQLNLPATLPVNRMEVEEYTDSTGEPSWRVLVVLDNSADASHISGEDVGELKFAIRDALTQNGISGFPYVFLVREEELGEPDDEE